MRRVRLVLILAIEATVIALVAGTGLYQGSVSTALAEGPAAKGDRPASPPKAGPPGEGAAKADRPQRSERPMPPDREGDEGRRGMRVSPMFRDVTDEDVAAILKFVGEHMPWMKADIEKMLESNPGRFRLLCRHLRFEIAQLRRLKAHDPDAFRLALEEKKLKFRSMELAAKVRAAGNAKEREALRGELLVVLDRLFDAETATRAAQIRQLESRLEALRKELKDRSAARREIIEKRLKEILEGRPENRPGPPPAPTPPDEKQ